MFYEHGRIDCISCNEDFDSKRDLNRHPAEWHAILEADGDKVETIDG